MSTILKKAPMGWNSWDCYGAGVDEATVRKNAEFMAENLKAFGWEYVVVDIQWAGPDAKTHDYIPFQRLAMWYTEEQKQGAKVYLISTAG